MNLEHLKLFVRLAAVNSISQAGEDLGLSPAVASSHLRKLEDSLGVRLLHRTTRHVALVGTPQPGSHSLKSLFVIRCRQALRLPLLWAPSQA